MPTRNQTASRQRNSAHKVQPTLITGRKAVCVRIEWTESPVIKTTARRAYKLFVAAIETRSGAVLSRGSMNIDAGAIVYFTRANSLPAGWYYITIAGQSCTCTAGLYQQPCHHHLDITNFELARIEAAKARETCPAVIEALDRIAAAYSSAA